MTHRKPPAPQRVFTATIAPAGNAAPRRIAAVLTMSSLFACAGDPEPRADGILPVGHEEVLHVAEVNGQKFEFRTLSADADSPPMHFIDSSLRRGSRELVGMLFEHYGPLTMLEVFTALAPFDSAPLAIVQSHPVEAKTLGRQSDDVRAVNLDWLDAAEELVQAPPTSLIEKDFPPGAQEECLLTVFFDQGQINWSQHDIVTQSGFPGLPAGGMCVGGRSDFFFEPGLNFCNEFFSNVRTRVGMCHFDPDSETSVSQIGGSEQGSDMTYGSPRLMEFNDVRASTFFPTFPQRNAIVNFPPDSPFSYFLVSGIGN